ncbi:MAG: transcriptional regulator [Bacteroidia bacterium]|nr:transcriptional regulator [Bacteroidia bacterium]
MKTLKYKIIKSKLQYKDYCKTLEELVFTDSKNREIKDEIELLTFLIEKYDEAHSIPTDMNPIELLLSLMHDHDLKAKDLVQILGVSKGMVSDILHYKKGLSKDIIRTLADYFKMAQEAFNRPYSLKSEYKSVQLPVRVIKTTKVRIAAR